MNQKKWIAVSASALTLAAIAAWAFPTQIRTFRTTALFLGVTQKANTVHPQYDYGVGDGSNLVALALGTDPTSSQVFAMNIDCSSGSAALVAYDKSNSNSVTIAQCNQLHVILNQGARAGYVNTERFTGQFDVQSVGNIAGGSLMISGRLDLDSNGCPQAVAIKLDKDSGDKLFDDGSDVADTDQDSREKDILRAGRGHMVGWMDLSAGGTTNTMLIPLGHITLRRQLLQNSAP